MDRLIRATLPNIRVYVAETTTLAQEANRRHRCYPVAAAALGRALTGALLLSATMKEKERITIRIDGDGPLGLIVADAELDEMIQEGTAEIRCHFCNDVYQLTQTEMQAVKTGRQA